MGCNSSQVAHDVANPITSADVDALVTKLDDISSLKNLATLRSRSSSGKHGWIDEVRKSMSCYINTDDRQSFLRTLSESSCPSLTLSESSCSSLSEFGGWDNPLGDAPIFDEVSTNLFVGPKEALEKLENRNQFECILTVTDATMEPGCRCEVIQVGNVITKVIMPEKPGGKQITWLTLPLADKPREGHATESYADFIAKFYDTGYDFIKDALIEGKKVLVHCDEGKNRSASFAQAYLIRRFYEARSKGEEEPVLLEEMDTDDPNWAWVNQKSDVWSVMKNNEVFKRAYTTIISKRLGASPVSAYLPAVAKITKQAASEFGGNDTRRRLYADGVAARLGRIFA